MSLSRNIFQERYRCGRTLLHLAAASNNLSLVRQLLSRGADIDVKDYAGNTPLLYAASKNVDESHYEMIETLLKYGADPNAQDCTGRPPWFFVLKGSVKVVQLIFSYKADIKIVEYCERNALFPASEHDKYLSVLQLLINLGADINQRDANEHTPLEWACLHGDFQNIKAIKCLLKNGADENLIRQHGIQLINTQIEEFSWNNLDKKMTKKICLFLLEYTDFKVDSAIEIDDDIWDYDSTFHKAYKEHLFIIILEHLAVLKLLDIPVLENLLSVALKKKKFFAFFQQCQEELLVAMNSKLKNCWLTYFNLLVDNRRKLKNYAGNSDITEDFQKNDFSKKFPIYGSRMNENLQKGIKRREVFDESTILLSDCVPIFNPNHLIIRDILDCIMSKKDLSKLCSQ